tara:strand:- start:88 stop:1629 length:1542 start_codon:yes stop_codon:yes gene_type:complete
MSYLEQRRRQKQLEYYQDLEAQDQDYTPLGTNLKKGTLSNLEKLTTMAKADDARGAIMRGVGTGLQGIGTAYNWITEPLIYAAEDPSRAGSGEAILGTVLKGVEGLTKMGGRGSEMWATGADIQNPITKQPMGNLPRREDGQPWVDPDVARVTGEVLTGAVIEGGVTKGVKQLGNLTQSLKIAKLSNTLTPSPVGVTRDGLKIKPNIPDMIDPSKPLQIASNLQATPRVGRTTYGSLRTLVRNGDPQSLVQARKILESGWGGKLSKKNTLVPIDKLVGTDEGKVILNRLMNRSESIDKRFAKYYEKLGRKAKSTELAQRELYDVAAKNLYDASELIYGQKGARKYLSDLTKWFTKDEWHHIFGNKEAGEFLLSQVAQDPVVAVNLFKKMDNLGLFSSGIAKNIAVMKQAPHKALHRWYVKHGFQGGAADFGELGRELGEAVVAGKADVNDLFRMLELHSDFNKHVRGLIKSGKFGKYGDEVKLLDEIPEGVGKALQIGGYRARGPSKVDAFYR